MRDATGELIKILIADDEKIVADILREQISDQNRSIEICHDGLQAVKRLQEGGFDLIILDLVMPGLTGLEVLKYAKKLDPDLIVIIITGYATLETAIAAIKEGAYDYIRKPCKLEEMRIVVDRATEKVKQDRSNRELVRKLHDIYEKITVPEKASGEDREEASVPFFSSDAVELDYLLKRNTPASNHIERLQALSALRENGSLTEGEFRELKKHLLKTLHV